ncbi:MAG TPA: hypothetical protein VNO70_17695 [Blastocatellia bacterium]|nr:hypothetical protein [Blastocatellia bacterium]
MKDQIFMAKATVEFLTLYRLYHSELNMYQKENKYHPADETDVTILCGNIVVGSATSFVWPEWTGVLLGPVVSGLFSLLCLWLRHRWSYQAWRDRERVAELERQLARLQGESHGKEKAQ